MAAIFHTICIIVYGFALLVIYLAGKRMGSTKAFHTFGISIWFVDNLFWNAWVANTFMGKWDTLGTGANPILLAIYIFVFVIGLVLAIFLETDK